MIEETQISNRLILAGLLTAAVAAGAGTGFGMTGRLSRDVNDHTRGFSKTGISIAYILKVCEKPVVI